MLVICFCRFGGFDCLFEGCRTIPASPSKAAAKLLQFFEIHKFFNYKIRNCTKSNANQVVIATQLALNVLLLYYLSGDRICLSVATDKQLTVHKNYAIRALCIVHCAFSTPVGVFPSGLPGIIGGVGLTSTPSPCSSP